jgi:hypothetical protein
MPAEASPDGTSLAGTIPARTTPALTIPAGTIPPGKGPAAALARLQQDFTAAVLAPVAGPPPDLAAAPVPPSAALAVHRTNTRVGLANALASAFPAVAALMGRQEFAAMAWSYQRARPPTRGDLFHAGEQLPPYLAAHLAGTGDELLAPLAALEWQVQQVMVAAEPPATFDLEALAEVPSDRQGDLLFMLSPAVALLQAPAGTAALWEQYRGFAPAEAPAAPLPPPDAATEDLLLARRDGRLVLRYLSPGEAGLLQGLGAGASFAAAVDAALAAEPAFAAATVLAQAVRQGVITGFRLPG